MSIKRRGILFLIMLLFIEGLTMAANVNGAVVDPDGEPLIQASLRLLRAKDSTFVSGTTTNNKGRFRMNNVAQGNFILETTYIGYDKAYTNVTVGSTNVNVGTIKMTENSTLLKDITVVGIATPVKVMEDTIEYNTGAYKTQPNAVVEDLLKRLPGVEVSSDGKITVNGKEVSKILLDGQEFFSDDPTVASRNLPVDIVDRVQVVDRKSDLARLTGVDDGEDETVINLSIKPGMKNGWIGTVEGGYGTDDRYKGNFMVNHFNNGNQYTFLGNINNINNLGFGDGGNRFRRFGGSNGITTSRALGMNFNVGNGEIFRVGGNILYSNTDRNVETKQARQYLYADSTSFTGSEKKSLDRGHNVRADFRMLWKPDSFNTFEFRPNISLNYNKSQSNETSNSQAGDVNRTPVTSSLNDVSARGSSVEIGLRAIYNHSFKSRPGRSFSVMANYNYSNKREKEDSYSYNRFFLNDSIDVYDQYSDNHTWSHSASGRLSWTEPLGDVKKGNFLTFSYQARYRWNDADKMTYDHPVLWAEDRLEPIIDKTQLVFNDTLSNQFRNDYFNQQIRLGYKHVSKTTTIDVGVSLVPQMSKSIDLIDSNRNIDTRWVWNVAPFLNYKYRMGKQRSLDIRYRGRTSEPSMTQLQPVPDRSDPLRIVIGNPNLAPSFTHNVNVRFQDFNQDAQRSIMAMGNVQVQQNTIVSKTTFDPLTSGQVTEYTNVNGVWSARLGAMFSQPFTNRHWTFNNNLWFSTNRNVGFNNGDRNASFNTRIAESFSIAWRPDNFEFELRPYYNLQLTANSLPNLRNQSVHTYGGRLDATYVTPFGLTINTDVSYASTSGYSAGYDTNQWMWNAQISYQFLRGKAATIALKVYDLLQQQQSIMRNVTAQYIDDTEYNSLTRYFMVTFSYKFNTMGTGDAATARNDFMGGPRGGRPPR
ncbi:MAG: outer membrane beta-barrel protein [Muribaculaceae bacterium]|nr:outer membrane beta-barrel protein [Muribaculaceae bacterium]